MSETGLIFEAALANGAVWRHFDRTDAGVLGRMVGAVVALVWRRWV